MNRHQLSDIHKFAQEGHKKIDELCFDLLRQTGTHPGRQAIESLKVMRVTDWQRASLHNHPADTGFTPSRFILPGMMTSLAQAVFRMPLVLLTNEKA